MVDTLKNSKGIMPLMVIDIAREKKKQKEFVIIENAPKKSKRYAKTLR